MSDSWIRDTGILLTAACVAIFLAKGHPAFLYAALVCSLATILWYKVFYPVAYAWLWVSKMLALIVPKLFFGIVFFLVVTPIGLIRQFFAKDSLRTVGWKSLKTGFIERNHVFTAADGQYPY